MLQLVQDSLYQNAHIGLLSPGFLLSIVHDYGNMNVEADLQAHTNGTQSPESMVVEKRALPDI